MNPDLPGRTGTFYAGLVPVSNPQTRPVPYQFRVTRSIADVVTYFIFGMTKILAEIRLVLRGRTNLFQSITFKVYITFPFVPTRLAVHGIPQANQGPVI